MLTLLAITELNRAKEIVEVREEAMGKGLEYLEQAYQENPTSPLVLALVAEFLFYRDNDEKVWGEGFIYLFSCSKRGNINDDV